MRFARLLITVSALTVLALALCTFSGQGASTMLVRGKVFDAATKAPIAGAEITFKDLDQGKVIKIKTDKNGQYMQRLQWGNYKAFVKVEGYQPREEPRVAKPEGTDETTLDFEMYSGTGYIASELTKEEREKLMREEEERKKKEKLTAELKAFFDEAMTLKQNQDYKGAVEKLNQALALEPAQPVVLGQIANCYDLAGDADKAIDAYKKAIEASPKDGALRTNLGTLYHKKGMVDDAQKVFQEAAAVDPLRADVNNYNVGVLMLNSNKMDEALDAFNKCIDANPKYAAAYYQKSMCLLNKGDAKGSLEMLEAYLKMEPAGPFSQSAKDLLPEVKKMVN